MENSEIDLPLNYSEEDTKRLFITKQLEKAGWTGDKVKMEVHIKAGRIIGENKRQSAGSADYVLYYGSSSCNKPIAVVEAKRYQTTLGMGREQSIEYAQKLGARFAFCSNGKGFICVDLLDNSEKEFKPNEFPTVEELTNIYLDDKNISEKIKEIWKQQMPYIDDKQPRYYQTLAINRTIEAIASGKKRIMLVMATGTGKTYVASNICWKLLKTGFVHKILYLADRNILINQTITGDFKPFNSVQTTIHKTDDISKMKAYQVFFALYQGLTDKRKNDELFDPLSYIKEKFPSDFFDLIIIDECHRGSSRKDSEWRSILDYFECAIQIGMTATPKENKKVSNIDYFGEPLLTYKLSDGIDDGYLAPYKVVRINIDKDLEGYRPTPGTLDEDGNVVPDELYKQNDFDKKIIIDERTKLVAKRITDFMQKNDPMAKTIVFCVDIEHAERMRQALVQDERNKKYLQKNENYIVRVTGGKYDKKIITESLIDKFSDPQEPYPVICTTSDLLTTGVDCKTCKVIVIDTMFGEEGMTKFKQIIGRGTRIKEDYGKYTFTILDFRNASRLFADPAFNGEPTNIIDSDMNDDNELKIVEETEDFKDNEENDIPRKKIRVNGIDVMISNEKISYYDENGKLVTKKYTDYAKDKFLLKCATLDDFLNRWIDSEKRAIIKDELSKLGIDLEELRSEVKIKNIDDFDLLCHIVFDKKPLTRSERAMKAKESSYFDKYGEKARKVIDILLDKYADGAIDDISNMDILKLPELTDEFGSPVSIVKLFGNKQEWKSLVKKMSQAIYRGI
ncbi:MAG: DEAD/DEAH box helicase family protein [Mycoplasmataceae bacterium]|nr:DEAD/DEAH box helicase family protein [Mycoplasmataceae bacterium]